MLPLTTEIVTTEAFGRFAPSAVRRPGRTRTSFEPILTVAEQMAPARTVSASGAATMEDLLRPLRSAVRSARTAAVNASARDGLTA